MRHALLIVALLLIASPAAADEIGIFTDASGADCGLAGGFTESATVMHKFCIGATAVRFKLTAPPGSVIFSFNTEYEVLGSVVAGDGTVQYGECKLGSFPIGTITALLTQGELWTRPVDGSPHIEMQECDETERTAYCAGAYVGYGSFPGYCPSCLHVATEPSTWGAVKALYR